MEITETSKGLTFKAATVAGATTSDEARDFVLAHFGETLSRVFDWHVVEDVARSTFTVILYTA